MKIYAIIIKDDSPEARLRALAHAAELESLGLEPADEKQQDERESK